jgi:hypothetical protein
MDKNHPHDKEMTMNPHLSYYLATARTADLRQQAQRDALARTARQARREQRDRDGHPAPRLPAAGRRVLAFLNARSA